MDSKWIAGQVGALVSARRKRMGITQQKLAARIGVSRATLANIETGRQNMLLPLLYQLAEALSLKPADLLPEPVALENSAQADRLPLPENLNRVQRAQLARLLRDDTDSMTAKQETGDATRKERPARKRSR